MPSFTSQSTRARGLSLAAALLAALTAATAGAQGNPPTTTADSASARNAAPQPGAPAAGPTLREPVAEMYTDAKIAATASVSNQSEIQPSRLALQKTGNPQVREFAQRMIADHTRLEQQMQQLLQRKGVTPEHNAYSYQLQQNNYLPPLPKLLLYLIILRSAPAVKRKQWKR